MDLQTRTCNICGETKPLKSFPKTGKWHLKKCQNCYATTYRKYNMAKATRLRRFIHDCKRKSERMSWTFNLTVEFLEELFEEQKGLCPITGFEMTLEGTREFKKKRFTASLDRIDSGKGYTKDNVWFVTLQANYMKSQLTMEELVNWCQRIVEQQKGKFG